MENDIVKIATEMQGIRDEIKKVSMSLFASGKLKAEAEGDYDKAIALTLIKLKNGIEMGIDGHMIKDPPASTSEKIAKGICFQQCVNMSLAESKYKSTVSYLNGLLARLNSLQSQFRHLETEA